ncbi:unnamed protein product [Phytophthora fragariaefolia]|uniref:Unnamed protein product n=1 Tax=Phytophthora fragariaefolia TaxID=1490495 RepID=A0A9W6Y981_9STRA|nr:unnamed protein product [Phytophthora fragariaefolia]
MRIINLMLFGLLCGVCIVRVQAAKSPSVIVGARVVLADQTENRVKRSLRVPSNQGGALDTETPRFVTGEKRDIGVTQVVSTVVRSMRAKAKWIILLKHGFGPAKAMRKLKIKSVRDANFNNFARFYARYLQKHPKKAASLPATAEEAATAVKLDQWLVEKVLPPQIRTKLIEFGLKETAKYERQYMSMWGAKQSKLSANAK